MRPLSREEFTLSGRGEAVLLVHGLGGGPYELQRLGERVHAELGWTVRAVQLPGHREAAPLMPHSTWQQWLAGVEDALDALEHDTGCAAVHVVGFSTGSLPALRLAESGRLRGKVAVLAPFFSVFRPLGLNVEPAMGLLPYVPRRAPPLRNRVTRAEVERCVPFQVFSTRAARSALELAKEVLADAARITAPTLIVQGDADTVVDAAGATRLAARLTGPHQLVVVKGSDHLLTLDDQRDEVFRAVLEFLER
jgi:carboxylesterase